MKLPPFQTLVDEYAHPLHRFLCGLVGVQAAEDCLQETLLAALDAYARLRHGRNLKGWMFTIAYRKGVDHLRRSSKEIPSASVDDHPSPPEPVRDIELWEGVAALPPKQKTAVTLRYLGDLPYSEVAGIMDISAAAARQNVRAGLVSLRKELA